MCEAPSAYWRLGEALVASTMSSITSLRALALDNHAVIPRPSASLLIENLSLSICGIVSSTCPTKSGAQPDVGA